MKFSDKIQYTVSSNLQWHYRERERQVNTCCVEVELDDQIIRDIGRSAYKLVFLSTNRDTRQYKLRRLKLWRGVEREGMSVTEYINICHSREYFLMSGLQTTYMSESSNSRHALDAYTDI